MQEILSKKLLNRILPVTWNQPLIYSNGSYGNDELAVYRTTEDGGSFRGGDAWAAFASTSGYNGNWTGCYRDERVCYFNLYMATKKPICVTGFSCYYPSTDSASGWGSVAEGWFYGSNDNANWNLLMWHGGYGANSTNYQTFGNSNYYKYHRYRIRSNGSGHKDLIQVSSVRLTAVYEDFV
jgi:hypothetical protein